MCPRQRQAKPIEPSGVAPDVGGVSRGVVVEAYEQLVAEGYLTARQGAGTVVAARAAAPVAARTPVAPPPAGPLAARRYDFRYGTPDLSAFSRSAWLAAGARALRALPDARLGYGDARGAIELRQALAAYLGRVRGVRADPELIVIGGGTRANLGVLWRVLRETGASRVAIEDPGSSRIRPTRGRSCSPSTPTRCTRGTSPSSRVRRPGRTSICT